MPSHNPLNWYTEVYIDCIIGSRFSGSRAILSGPAGGVVGYATTSYEKETAQPVIGFDMGGKQLKP